MKPTKMPWCARVVAVAVLSVAVSARGEAPFSRGDSNCDGKLDISDAIHGLQWLFSGGGEPCCRDTADTNDDGSVDLSDAVFSLLFLFQGRSTPAAPFPDCGLDPTADGLDCASYPHCGAEDSDENGIPDAEERGPLPRFPTDTDADSTPDFLDRDDDADGILDIHDPLRLTPLVAVDSFDPESLFFLDSARTGAAPELSAYGAARVGDEIVLEGAGFAPEPLENLVLFAGEGAPLNSRPTAASEVEVRVVVPEGATRSVALLSGGRRTSDLPMTILPAGAPLLFTPAEAFIQNGATLILRGRGLGSVDEVRFGATAAAPASKLEDQLEVVVPEAAASGPVTAVAAGISSNAVFITVLKEAVSRLVLPRGAQVDFAAFTVVGSGEGATPDASGTAPVLVDRRGADHAYALLRGEADEPPAPYFMAVTVPGDAEVVLSALSTAVAMVLEQGVVLQKGNAAAIQEARSSIERLPIVQDLAAAIARLVAADPRALAGPAPSLRDLFLTAVLASDPYLAVVGGGGAGDSVGGQATFIPQKQFNISLEQVEGEGYIRIRNATMLFLSAEIRRMRSGALLAAHANSFIDDAAMIGPEAGILRLTYDSKKAYPRWPYLNMKVQVITPGAARPLPQTERQQEVHSILFLRTVTERVILPVIALVVGIAPIDGLAGIFIKEFMVQFPSVVKDAAKFAREGNPGQALLAILDVLIREAEKQGPFFEHILQKMITRGAMRGTITAKEFVARAGAGLRNLNVALIGLHVASTAVNVGITIGELLQTGAVLDYDVFFRLEVTGLNPLTIDRAPIPQVVQIRGFGFRPLADGTLPEVIVEDRGKLGSPATSTSDASQLVSIDEISPDGTLMNVVLDKLFVNDAEGPLAVRVRHDGEEASAPETIKVEGELRMTTLSPSAGVEGTEITIEGLGFRPEPAADLRVRFEEPQPGNRLDPFLLSASVLSVTETKVIAKVPSLPPGKDTGFWKVYVEQGSITRRVRSNQKSFYTKKYLPFPSGLLGLADVNSGAGVGFLLHPNGWVSRLPIRDGVGATIGTWSMSGSSLSFTSCIPKGPAYDFEGTVVEGEAPFQVCCDFGSPGCPLNFPADWPCPAVEGLLTQYYPDRPEIAPFVFEVNNRFVPGGALAPGLRIPGYVALSTDFDWDCATSCGQSWQTRFGASCICYTDRGGVLVPGPCR